ncbi:MAG TPA: TonB-dependent receptor [Bacteroidales bacterium]|nr:TonB-dependent receptor [Bacteroidales bacterium]
MKISAFIIFLAVLEVAAESSFSQDKKVNVKVKEAKISELLSQIERQTNYLFFYNSKEINVDKEITLEARNTKVADILHMVFNGSDVNYQMRNDHIVLTKKAFTEKITPLKEIAYQKKKITGTVIDASSREFLPGVNVIIEGTSIGTVTDIDGKFTLEANSATFKLVFSIVGYNTETVEVTNQTTLEVSLIPSIEKLEEVVVVGYGSQRKASVIGSITTIAPKKLISSNANLSSSLAGQLAGVLAVQRSGEPGSDQSEFWIRGISTFNANSQKALVLVDGVERDMNNVDPLDIESFSILKDATATAVYGVRGANGVILINTRKGATGKPQIQVQLEQGMVAPVKLPSYIDGAKYMEIYNEACRFSNVPEKYTQERIDKTRSGENPDLYPDVNWVDEVFRDFSTSQKLNLNVSGGTDKIRYYVSGAYLHENGILDPKDMEDKKSELKFDRFNFRSNIDIDLTKSTLFKLNIGGYYKEKNQPGNDVSSIFYSCLASTPIGYPVQYSDGKFAHLGGTMTNPWMASTHSGYSMNAESQIESTISLEQKLDFITEGLSAKGLFSFDTYNDQITVLRKNPTTYHAEGLDSDGNIIYKIEEGTEFVSLENQSSPGTRRTYMEAQLNYAKTLAEKHNISALILYNQTSSKNTPATTEVLSLPYRNNGLAGRLTYNFDSRYFIEGNFGYNGSENFAPGNKYGFFPSVAVGWLISEERFFKNNFSSVINKLKFKGSYGLVGNDQISASRRFGYLTLLSTGIAGYSWGYDGKSSMSGIGVSEYGDQNMTWEKAQKTNLGVELGLWNMIDISLDVYREYRKDIYMRMNSVPDYVGVSALPYGNLGEMSNKGIDLSLIVNKNINNNLFISVNGSFTYASNKIEEMDEPDNKYAYQNKKGKQFGQIFGLLDQGLYTSADFNTDGTLKEGLPVSSYKLDLYPGDIKYTDYNDDGVINDYDKVAIGYATNPEIVYGIGATVQYKDFDLGFLIQGVGRTSLMLGNDDSGIASFFFPCQSSGIQGNILDNIDDRWTEANPSQDVFWPRLSTNGVNKNNNQPSTWWLRDASFWRLKNIEVGYKFNVLKGKIDLLRVYLRGTNLYTWSKDFKDLWDPELASANGMKYPTNMVLTVGCELKF